MAQSSPPQSTARPALPSSAQQPGQAAQPSPQLPVDANTMSLLFQQNQQLMAIVTMQAQQLSQQPNPYVTPALQPPMPMMQVPTSSGSNGAAHNSGASPPVHAPKQFTFQNVNANGDGVSKASTGSSKQSRITVHRPSAVGVHDSLMAAQSVVTSNLPPKVSIENGHSRMTMTNGHSRSPAPKPPSPAPVDWGVPPPASTSMNELEEPLVAFGQQPNSSAQQVMIDEPHRTQAQKDGIHGCCLFVCMTGVCAGLYAFLKCC